MLMILMMRPQNKRRRGSQPLSLKSQPLLRITKIRQLANETLSVGSTRISRHVLPAISSATAHLFAPTLTPLFRKTSVTVSPVKLEKDSLLAVNPGPVSCESVSSTVKVKKLKIPSDSEVDISAKLNYCCLYYNYGNPLLITTLPNDVFELSSVVAEMTMAAKEYYEVQGKIKWLSKRLDPVKTYVSRGVQTDSTRVTRDIAAQTDWSCISSSDEVNECYRLISEIIESDDADDQSSVLNDKDDPVPDSTVVVVEDKILSATASVVKTEPQSSEQSPSPSLSDLMLEPQLLSGIDPGIISEFEDGFLDSILNESPLGESEKADNPPEDYKIEVKSEDGETPRDSGEPMDQDIRGQDLEEEHSVACSPLSWVEPTLSSLGLNVLDQL